MAKVVATLDPETAAKIMQVSTQVIGRPPCTPPTRLLANSTRRRLMPPVSIRLPARMKNGMAASGNLSMAVNISLGARISRSGSNSAMPRMAEPPMDTAMEMLKAKPSSIVISRVNDMVVAAYCAASSSSLIGAMWWATTASIARAAPTGSAA